MAAGTVNVKIQPANFLGFDREKEHFCFIVLIYYKTYILLVFLSFFTQKVDNEINIDNMKFIKKAQNVPLCTFCTRQKHTLF